MNLITKENIGKIFTILKKSYMMVTTQLNFLLMKEDVKGVFENVVFLATNNSHKICPQFCKVSLKKKIVRIKRQK